MDLRSSGDADATELRVLEAERRLRDAEHRLEQALRSLEEVRQMRIAVLEQLLDLRDAVEGPLSTVPKLLHRAYREGDGGPGGISPFE